MRKKKNIDESIKQQIFDAAKDEFFAKGYDGARMQVIANKARINKAMLHYYFDSKAGLFHEVFLNTFQSFIPIMIDVFSSKETFFDKIRIFIPKHIEFFQQNPLLPLFLNNELAKGNVHIKEILPFAGKNKINLLFTELVNQEVKSKRIRPIEPSQLFIHILSVSVFPFLGKNMLSLSLGMDSMQFDLLLEKRKKEGAEFIIQAIKMK